MPRSTPQAFTSTPSGGVESIGLASFISTGIGTESHAPAETLAEQTDFEELADTFSLQVSAGGATAIKSFRLLRAATLVGDEVVFSDYLSYARIQRFVAELLGFSYMARSASGAETFRLHRHLPQPLYPLQYYVQAAGDPAWVSPLRSELAPLWAVSARVVGVGPSAQREIITIDGEEIDNDVSMAYREARIDVTYSTLPFTVLARQDSGWGSEGDVGREGLRYVQKNSQPSAQFIIAERGAFIWDADDPGPDNATGTTDDSKFIKSDNPPAVIGNQVPVPIGQETVEITWMDVPDFGFSRARILSALGTTNSEDIWLRQGTDSAKYLKNTLLLVSCGFKKRSNILGLDQYEITFNWIYRRNDGRGWNALLNKNGVYQLVKRAQDGAVSWTPLRIVGEVDHNTLFDEL